MKSLSKSKTRRTFFEKELKLKDKGAYQVWKSEISVLGRKIHIFLHAVNDSKIVYRISTRYGAKPAVKMVFTNDSSGKKLRDTFQTSGAHKAFRKRMGANDQSDAKRSRIRLSAKYFKSWPQKLVAKTLEDCITNAYLNYLLDPGCKVEPWPAFLTHLVQELLDSGEDMRVRKPCTPPSRGFRRIHKALSNKRPRPGSDESLLIGERCPGGHHIISQKFLELGQRSKVCAFCGRQKPKYQCRSCKKHLCMRAPRPIAGKSFVPNGTFCYMRFHGFHKYTR